MNKFCEIPKEDLRAEIHIYPDIKVDDAVKYWKEITGFNTNQFYKVQIDDRVNKKKIKARILPYGTIHILMKAGRLGVRNTHRKIMSWINIIAGVV